MEVAGVPPEWIVPGHDIVARGILTESGPVSFQLRWDRQGKEATLDVEPVGRKRDSGGLRISFRAFTLAGYRHVSGVPAGGLFLGSKGQKYSFTITR